MEMEIPHFEQDIVIDMRQIIELDFQEIFLEDFSSWEK
jgi:hypothetical protein